jgi:homocysteine S-methyltransferase
MTAIAGSRASILRGVRVLDGGLATELESRGASIDGPLWSAHLLEEAPEKISAVHRAYIGAGAQCIETAGYQVSRMGYAECGLGPERADAALLRAVGLARAAAAEFPGWRIVVAASLGPYGAALHNGAEYTGDYPCSFASLVEFHRQRIAVLATAAGANKPDLLAFETLPSLDEARAIAGALNGWPELAAWFSFTCRDRERVAHGEQLRDCAAAVAALPQTVAIGVNCTHPSLLPALIGELRAASTKPIIVYPNSGEGWDAQRRCWTGSSDPGEFGAKAEEWFKAGAQTVGGCCRTRPAHIRAVAAAAARIESGSSMDGIEAANVKWRFP